MNAQLMQHLKPNTKEWLEERKKHIGASDAPAIMCESQYNSPLDIWLSKQPEFEPIEQNDLMRRGHVLEMPIVMAISRVLNIECGPSLFCIHKDHEFMSATPDAMILNQNAHLQVKTHVSWVKDEYGESGTSEVPVAEYIQVQHEMAVAGTEMAYLVVLLAESEVMDLMVGMIDDGVSEDIISKRIEQMDLRYFPIFRDEDLIADMIKTESGWWQTHIVNGEKPMDITKARPKNKECRHATAEEIKRIDIMKKHYLALERAKLRVEKNGQILRSFIGEDYGIMNPLTKEKITWGKDKDTIGSYTHWEGIAMALIKEMNVEKEKADEIIDEFTKPFTKEGSRSLRLPYKQWKKEGI